MASGTKKTKKSSTSEMKKNDNVGQDKCPKCGATDISLNVKIGMLRCNYCRHEFSLEKTKNVDIDNLVGEVFSEASEDIDENKNIITLKCESCGSEVVVDTSENTQKRCHWCRNTLSIDSKVPNGAVPDIVLPFKVEKNDARKQISYFVDKRKFFANKKFKKEFTTENIVGVYLPYIVVDVNAHAKFSGLGEHQTREYRVGTDEHERTVYDADEYTVSRDYDLVINGLTI